MSLTMQPGPPVRPLVSGSMCSSMYAITITNITVVSMISQQPNPALTPCPISPPTRSSRRALPRSRSCIYPQTHLSL
ncbi:hypothetical protein E8E13_003120 [Curvularia kusanoi]|uniref:Uncharacterized protein n=1 Tax=Curvularia kusanoi TaxID=90978 RepID=A0A9P4W867_CURKU|nr:hypothetical protein E8E13_003120 [Curvularia kusanoi]